MHKAIRKWLKHLLKIAPVALTQNERYDRLTEQVIKRVCKADAVCIDVGANEGKILAMFIKHCPLAMHFAFEPVPVLYKLLVRKFGSASRVYPIALGQEKGVSAYNVANADLAYSGFKKRADKQLNDITIEVEIGQLDDLIPATTPIRLIKIDVEGAEYHVLSGAERILHQHKPFILFEYGQGGADAFNITPVQMFTFLNDRGYQINLLDAFLKGKTPLTVNAFEMFYRNKKEYFFIGYP